MIGVGYIDTSFLLSILFKDDNYDKSVDLWNEISVFVSSVLLEIEAHINICKYFVIHLTDGQLYKTKSSELHDMMENINRKNVDDEIILEIKNIETLKRPKSSDSIHLATANIFNKLVDEKITVCTYDRNMSTIAKELGMATI